MRKALVVWLVFMVCGAPLWAQRVKQDRSVVSDVEESPVTTGLFVAPVGLITAGSVIAMMPSNSEFCDSRLQRRFAPSDGKRENIADDFLQFAPISAAIALPLTTDIPHRSTTPNLLAKTAISQVTMMAIVEGMKFGFNKQRPNGSRHSFPSGHTAQSFLGAQILYLEYRDTNKWIAYSGYPIATFVGMERVMNNMHWESDVLVGAGIGMLVPTVVYWANDRFYKKKASLGQKHKSYTVSFVPFATEHTTGLGVNIDY